MSTSAAVSRLARLVSNARESGKLEFLHFWSGSSRWTICCKWDSGVPFISARHPDGGTSNVSSHHALGLLLHATPRAFRSV